jgi:hypothetical protein
MTIEHRPAAEEISAQPYARFRKHPLRVAVVYEPGRRGTAALGAAVELTARTASELTVLALAPQARALQCTGPSPQAYNCAVIEHAASELNDAARELGPEHDGARFRMLIQGLDPAIERWVVENDIDVVLLPGRWRGLGPPRHPAARAIRRRTGAEVRVISTSRI